VVAAGASYDAIRARAATDDIVVRFAPQIALLPRMTAVIGHGGNNSTNETLRAGKPLVVVPFGGEQIANARRVEALGVGIALDPARLTGERVAEAVRAVLEPGVVARASELAAAVPEGDGAAIVADALERLAPTS
jgi:UDP:flavonoid glycosyltransferase YjiC (YdhE family)